MCDFFLTFTFNLQIHTKTTEPFQAPVLNSLFFHQTESGLHLMNLMLQLGPHLSPITERHYGDISFLNPKDFRCERSL